MDIGRLQELHRKATQGPSTSEEEAGTHGLDTSDDSASDSMIVDSDVDEEGDRAPHTSEHGSVGTSNPFALLGGDWIKLAMIILF